MQVRVREGAASLYENRTVISYRQPASQRYKKMLEQIEGKVVDIDTTYLFKDQFNTAPIPGVSEQGLRLTLHEVDQVIDDARPGKGRCNYCGATVPACERSDACPNCGRCGYVENF